MMPIAYLMRVCTNCKQVKQEEAFSWRWKDAGIRQDWCKLCINAHDKAVYHSNPERRQRLRETEDKITQRNVAFVRDYLTQHPCVDCGEPDFHVLEFDHQGDKVMNLSDMTRRGFSLTRLALEIAKCEVRCANCHRRKTFVQLGWN